MSVDCFLDTNVLVYAACSGEADARKGRKALDLVQRLDFGLSAQVLQEFYVTVTRKIRKPLSPALAVALMDEYRVFPTAPIGLPPDRVGRRAVAPLRHLLLGRGDHRRRGGPRGSDAIH